MNIVIPMAGKGARFRQQGITTPKPMIDVCGKPMFIRAVESLPLANAARVILLCLKEHSVGFGLNAAVEKYLSSYSPLVIEVDEVTRGQACTVLLAKSHINSSMPLMIFNSDSMFKSELTPGLPELPPNIKDADGIIGVFRSQESRWSYAKVNERGYVVQVAEKKVISEWATTGMYYFSRGTDFVQAAEEMIEKKITLKNEYYVGPMYNLLIKRGAKIVLDIVKRFDCMGTPEELKTYLSEITVRNRRDWSDPSRV